MINVLNNSIPSSLSTKYKLRGPNIVTSTACSAGLNAMTDAYLYLK